MCRRCMGGEAQAPTFGRYRLCEQLGAGGMAVVHRAVADGPWGFARAVVIKRIVHERSHDPTFVNMLACEARLCGLLHHPNIVQVHEFGEVNGEHYLAMELVEGADLTRIIRASLLTRRAMDPGLVCHIVTELAEALAYAHSLTDEEGRPLEIVHRDISPSNIMLTTQGAVKLLDFGIAKAASHIWEEHARSGTFSGKLSYMSPEQAEGLPTDRRSDIFSLGVVFHECLTMKRLFKGETDLETLCLVRRARAPRPSELVRDLDPEIDAVVLKMLAPSPADRYQSCDDVVAALTPLTHRLNVDAGAVRRFVAGLGPIPRRKLSASAEPPTRPTREYAHQVLRGRRMP